MQNVIAGAEAVLGPDALDILADALKCSRARFNSPSPRAVAVVELLAAAAALGLSAEDLPARWRGGRVPIADLRRSFVKLFAPRSPVPVLRRALGLSAKAVNARLKASSSSRQFAEFAALAELLRVVKSKAGVEAWPLRWKPPVHPDNARDLQARVVDVLGEYGTAHLAAAAGYTREYLSSVWRGDPSRRGNPVRPSESLTAIVELLEILDREGVSRDRWPDRWRGRRSSLAAAALGETDTGAAAVFIDDDNAGGFERGADCGERVNGDRAPLCFEVADSGEPDASGGGEFCLR
jgi:hypothetical protein